MQAASTHDLDNPWHNQHDTTLRTECICCVLLLFSRSGVMDYQIVLRCFLKEDQHEYSTSVMGEYQKGQRGDDIICLENDTGSLWWSLSQPRKTLTTGQPTGKTEQHPKHIRHYLKDIRRMSSIEKITIHRHKYTSRGSTVTRRSIWSVYILQPAYKEIRPLLGTFWLSPCLRSVYFRHLLNVFET